MSLATAPLNALRAFEAAARHGSFAQAAAELGVSPAAVSQQIRSLEARVGRKLFHRQSNRVILSGPVRRPSPGYPNPCTPWPRPAACWKAGLPLPVW